MGKLYAGFDDLANAIDPCKRIRAIEYQVVSESDFSLDDPRNSRKLDSDYLSVRDTLAGEVTPTT